MDAARKIYGEEGGRAFFKGGVGACILEQNEKELDFQNLDRLFGLFLTLL